MVSPIYFVSFVLTAQFVLVNVVIAVLMKHLEESNKEANENAEAEADLDLELQMDMGDMGARSPQLHPLVLGVDRSSSGGSPLRSTGEEGEKEPEPEREVLMDSPAVDITRDSAEMTEEPPPCLEPPAQVKTLFFLILTCTVLDPGTSCWSSVVQSIGSSELAWFSVSLHLCQMFCDHFLHGCGSRFV